MNENLKTIYKVVGGILMFLASTLIYGISVDVFGNGLIPSLIMIGGVALIWKIILKK